MASDKGMNLPRILQNTDNLLNFSIFLDKNQNLAHCVLHLTRVTRQDVGVVYVLIQCIFIANSYLK